MMLTSFYLLNSGPSYVYSWLLQMTQNASSRMHLSNDLSHSKERYTGNTRTSTSIDVYLSSHHDMCSSHHDWATRIEIYTLGCSNCLVTDVLAVHHTIVHDYLLISIACCYNHLFDLMNFNMAKILKLFRTTRLGYTLLPSVDGRHPAGSISGGIVIKFASSPSIHHSGYFINNYRHAQWPQWLKVWRWPSSVFFPDGESVTSLKPGKATASLLRASAIMLHPSRRLQWHHHASNQANS